MRDAPMCRPPRLVIPSPSVSGWGRLPPQPPDDLDQAAASISEPEAPAGGGRNLMPVVLIIAIAFLVAIFLLVLAAMIRNRREVAARLHAPEDTEGGNDSEAG